MTIKKQVTELYSPYQNQGRPEALSFILQDCFLLEKQ